MPPDPKGQVKVKFMKNLYLINLSSYKDDVRPKLFRRYTLVFALKELFSVFETI